ncbi:phage major capsid family protein [Pseudomonas sp. A6]|uniref:phage major capsid family protein n=1 Tax=Pseudomonas sp. A6 TaxID=410021 RepID=UPI00402A0BB7
MTQVSIVPKGQTFIRSLILRATMRSASEESMIAGAQARWGAYQGESIAKAAVGAILSSDISEPAQEFLGLVTERSLLGRLVGLRRTPFRTRMLKMVGGATAYWVPQGKPVPISKPSVEGATIDPLKVCAIICATGEAITLGGNLVEKGLQRDMERAVIDTLDFALIDASNAGIPDEMPAAITYGAPAAPATSDAAADIATLVGLFGGDIGAAFFVTDSVTAANMALHRNTSGALMFPDVGARGGSILGIPLLISRASPRDSSGGQLALIDPSGIAYDADGISIIEAQHASLAMSDTPTSPSEMVSLWQTNTVAFMATVNANWEVQRENSVALLTDVAWGA